MNHAAPIRKLRCAVYTRKSSEEGLDQDFNSLHAQREACEAYIASQQHEGWVLVPDRYDDGGISGGTLERPALQRLLCDVEAGLVDIVVVYKVDRLSRSLMDFAKLVELFERQGVSFVSITQQFSTTSSMGRLTLNMLLSFAQFEREVIGERIRDKFEASRKRGMWMGGWAPLGYDVDSRKLIINECEAKLVRYIFERFANLGSVTELVVELKVRGKRTKAYTARTGRCYGGRPFGKNDVYRILNNRIYLGEAVHKGNSYPGEHDAIVTQSLWDKAHAIMTESPRKRANTTRAKTPAPLKGLLRCVHCDAAMTPTHTRKRGRLYRYYACVAHLKRAVDDCPIGSISAAEIESVVMDQVHKILRSPEIVSRTITVMHTDDFADGNGPDEAEVLDAFGRIDEVWEELFPAEQARILHLLVNHIDVALDGIDVHVHSTGLRSLVAEAVTTADGQVAPPAPELEEFS